jgi:hypothetical protein
MINVSGSTVALGKPACSGGAEQTVAQRDLMAHQTAGVFVLDLQNTRDAFVLET